MQPNKASGVLTAFVVGRGVVAACASDVPAAFTRLLCGLLGSVTKNAAPPDAAIAPPWSRSMRMTLYRPTGARGILIAWENSLPPPVANTLPSMAFQRISTRPPDNEVAFTLISLPDGPEDRGSREIKGWGTHAQTTAAENRTIDSPNAADAMEVRPVGICRLPTRSQWFRPLLR